MKRWQALVLTVLVVAGTITLVAYVTRHDKSPALVLEHATSYEKDADHLIRECVETSEGVCRRYLYGGVPPRDPDKRYWLLTRPVQHGTATKPDVVEVSYSEWIDYRDGDKYP